MHDVTVMTFDIMSVIGVMGALYWSLIENAVVDSIKVILSTVSVHAMMIIFADINRFSDPTRIFVTVIIKNSRFFPVNDMIVLCSMIRDGGLMNNSFRGFALATSVMVPGFRIDFFFVFR